MLLFISLSPLISAIVYQFIATHQCHCLAIYHHASVPLFISLSPFTSAIVYQFIATQSYDVTITTREITRSVKKIEFIKKQSDYFRKLQVTDRRRKALQTTSVNNNKTRNCNATEKLVTARPTNHNYVCYVIITSHKVPQYVIKNTCIGNRKCLTYIYSV